MSKKQDKAERLEEIVQDMKSDYVYIKYMARFYWLQQKIFYRSGDAAANLLINTQELTDLRRSGVIKDYDNICYLKGGKEGCFNMLKDNSILLPSDNPILDKDIETLINNICGNKQENIEWLYKAILFKYTHINDFTLPCVVLFGRGGSGKGTLISLLATIFGEDNTMANLSQRDLMGSFDTYKGMKLVIEFAEVVTNNTGSDKLILNKLKNIIGAEKLTVNEKGVQAYQVENIVWAFISSNSNMPLLLDDKDKGNRRFTIIRSDTPLKNGKQINESVKDKKKVSDFICWLLLKYPEVIKLDSLESLDNQDKQDLEEISQNGSSAAFWEYYEKKFPENKGKILKFDIDIEIEKYCNDNPEIDFRIFKRYFWKTSKYTYRRLKYEKKDQYCVLIP